MRLKPKACSMRNWRYHSNGRSTTLTSSTATATISTWNRKPRPTVACSCAAIQSSPPSSVSATSRTALTPVSTSPKRCLAMV
jgi:hypothetical protein